MSGRERLSTGISGLDEILYGVFSERAHIATRGAGTGKTIIGLHSPMQAVEEGDETLFVSFEEVADRNDSESSHRFTDSDPPE